MLDVQSYGLLEPPLHASWTLVGTSSRNSGTPFFSVVMLLLDAAKISEKVFGDLLLLKAAFNFGWIPTRILEVMIEEEYVNREQLPSGMTPEHSHPSADLGQ